MLNEAINRAQERRFRLALRVVGILIEPDSPEIVKSWLAGLNPELGDRIPLRLLREEPVETIATGLLAAAHFIAERG